MSESNQSKGKPHRLSRRDEEEMDRLRRGDLTTAEAETLRSAEERIRARLL